MQVQLDPHFHYAQLLCSDLQFGEVHDRVTSSLIMMGYDMKNGTCIPTPMYSATKDPSHILMACDGSLLVPVTQIITTIL